MQPNPKNKFLLRLIIIFIVSLLILTGCSQADSTAQTNQAPAEEPAVPAAPIDETDTAAEGETSAGETTEEAADKILRVAFQPIVQTDPALISSDSEVFVANAVYDYFVDVDANSNPVPRLATEWSVSDDGLTYTFSLAEGVIFHDGSSFTAADVVWTYDRLRDPDLGFATSSLYANIVSIEAVDDASVVFTLENPNPFFLYDLSDNHALIVKDGTEDASDFNGTGPFKVVNYSPEDRVTLEANPDYYIEGQPKLAGVDIIFFPDDIAMTDALRGGQIDLVMRMSTSLFESLQTESGIKTVSIPTNGFDLIRLRSDREPGNDPPRYPGDEAGHRPGCHPGTGSARLRSRR